MKEIINKPNLLVFDMDGTIVDEPEFYRGVYSGTLNETIASEKGQIGLDALQWYRTNQGGKGELALAALGIPFGRWADRLIAAPLNLIAPQPAVVERLRSLDVRKVIYTGSPTLMALRILERFGFDPFRDFDYILGWESPQSSPMKWGCSPQPFRDILQQFNCKPCNAWSVGDNWETDLEPARQIGISTFQIGNRAGIPDYRFPSLAQFLSFAVEINLKGGD